MEAVSYKQRTGDTKGLVFRETHRTLQTSLITENKQTQWLHLILTQYKDLRNFSLQFYKPIFKIKKDMAFVTVPASQEGQ